jgi:hypothetical protein
MTDTIVAAFAAVDVEGVLKPWLRQQPILNDVIEQRVYIGAPAKLPVDGDGKLLRHLTIHLVNNPQLAGAVPGTNALVQFDCYGRTKDEAAQVCVAVMTLAQNMRGRVVIADGVVCGGGTIRRCQFMPDSASNRARYSLDIEFPILAGVAGP